MKLSDLSTRDLAGKLKKNGINLKIGPFSVRVKSGISQVIQGLEVLYADYDVLPDNAFADFHIQLTPPKGVRRWIHPQVLFVFDDRTPFKPLPFSQSFSFFEWGLNWCIAAHSNNYVILHAAVVEKHGQAIIFPGEPGAGKSTLCAALVMHGWRLLSDEMAVIDFESQRLIAIPRPISLKNESINVIQRRFPQAIFGPVAKDTTKGTVAHIKAPQQSITADMQQAIPAWIVIPNYQANAESDLKSQPTADMFIHLVKNAFNYSILGEAAFDLISDIVTQCQCYQLTYSNLDDAISVFDNIAANKVQ